MPRFRPYIVGIAGGTASGKTTLARTIADTLGRDRVSLVDADSYYRDLKKLPVEKRGHINFDHPYALDAELLREHIKTLKKNRPVEKHEYDFEQNTRARKKSIIQPLPLVIVEGILIFALKELRRLFDLKAYIDEAPDIRLVRRMLRDTRERGRSVENVADQYMNNVRPMHEMFVEPSKAHADIILSNGNGVDGFIDHLQSLLQQRNAAKGGKHAKK